MNETATYLDQVRERLTSAQSHGAPAFMIPTADVARLLDAVDRLLYVADNKAADNQVGRWWAAVIRGNIEEALGGKA